MFDDIQKEVNQILKPFCPNEAAFVTRLIKSVLEDALEIVCINPKCNDPFKGYKVTKAKDFKGFISMMLNIVFSLDI